MRYTIISAIFISFLFLGCKKDKFTAKPQLEYKSVNKTVLNRFDIVTFKFEFTDLDGDLDTVFVKKITDNCEPGNFDTKYALPYFPSTKKQKAELLISYSYGFVDGYETLGDPVCGHNDTCIFKFVLRDKKGNFSDTAVSDKIVVLHD